MSLTIVQAAAVASWIDAAKNTDGSAIQGSEITGYQLGIRPLSGSAGTYPVNSPAIAPSATSEALSLIATVLVPGEYLAAVRSVGPTNSPWSNEFAFNIAQPVPSAQRLRCS